MSLDQRYLWTTSVLHNTKNTNRKVYTCKFHGESCVFVTGIGCVKRKLAEKEFPPRCPCKCVKPKRTYRKEDFRRYNSYTYTTANTYTDNTVYTYNF